MLKVGFIVNPVAGMGGSVGLKGTDGEMHERAVELGAEPVSPARSREFLRSIRSVDQIVLHAAPGLMGARHVEAAGLRCNVVGEISETTGAGDTQAIARQLLDEGADLIVFAGGDGTARDMADAIGDRVPVIGIPSGVKIYSSVFAFSPRAAAELLEAFVAGADVHEEEVLDIDEDAFRDGRVDSRHYSFLLVPVDPRLVQHGKESSGSTPEIRRELALAAIDEMRPGIMYLLGSGTTVRAIAEGLGVAKTLLGIDAVVDGELIGSDLNERAILELLDRHPQATIIVTPLGGNGFIFGRGNKQFTPDVLRRVGLGNILIVADRDKLLPLDALHVDTGDAELDREFRGYLDVLIGHSYRKTVPVR